ncbi:MAG: hypothetical protein HFI76_13885 [Lachnospiraceae bacterium]|nr:hypothetical protein [Lachnospiraceae bacterium]
MIGIVWLAVAVVSIGSGNVAMAALYVILSGVFLYSAYGIWKKERDKKGGK